MVTLLAEQGMKWTPSLISACLFEIIPFEIKAFWNWKWNCSDIPCKDWASLSSLSPLSLLSLPSTNVLQVTTQIFQILNIKLQSMGRVDSCWNQSKLQLWQDKKKMVWNFPDLWLLGCLAEVNFCWDWAGPSLSVGVWSVEAGVGGWSWLAPTDWRERESMPHSQSLPTCSYWLPGRGWGWTPW